MGQYDVHRNADSAAASLFPYVVDVQSDMVRHLASRLVVPLGRQGRHFIPMRGMTPEVIVNGESLYFLAHNLVSVPRRILGPVVASLANRRVELLGAIDFLLTGV